MDFQFNTKLCSAGGHFNEEFMMKLELLNTLYSMGTNQLSIIITLLSLLCHCEYVLLQFMKIRF